MLLSSEQDCITGNTDVSSRDGTAMRADRLAPVGASLCCNTSILNYVRVTLALGSGWCYDIYIELSLHPNRQRTRVRGAGAHVGSADDTTERATVGAGMKHDFMRLGLP